MNHYKPGLTAALITLATCLAMPSGNAGSFERTEAREPCKDYTPERRPMFGDLHVHTSYSFDSHVSNQRDRWTSPR